MNHSDDAQATVEQRLQASSVWVAGLDRTFLGTYAIDARMLAYYHAYNQFNDSHPDVLGTYPAYNQAFLEKYHEINKTVTEDGFTSLAEMIFWVEETQYDGKITYAPGVQEESLLFLRSIAAITRNNAAAIPYVEAGIMDVDLIDTCIRDGVDPEIAGVLAKQTDVFYAQ